MLRRMNVFKRVGMLVALGLLVSFGMHHLGLNTEKGIYKAKDNQQQLEANIQTEDSRKVFESNKENRQETFNEKATNKIHEYYEGTTDTGSPFYDDKGNNTVYNGMLKEDRDNVKAVKKGNSPKSAWVDNEGNDIVKKGIEEENKQPQNERPYLNSDNTVPQDYNRGE